MGSPYTIVAIEDIPLSDSVEDLFQGKRGRRLTEPALVEIALNAEDVDVTAGATLGSTEILSAGSRVTLQATVGILPVFPDDVLIQSFGGVGDEIIVSGVNADAAAAAELRAVAKVTAISDVALRRAVLQGVGAV